MTINLERENVPSKRFSVMLICLKYAICYMLKAFLDLRVNCINAITVFSICTENYCARSKYRPSKVRIRSYYGPYFPRIRPDTDRYSVSLCIQSKCGKIRTRITATTDIFYEMKFKYVNILSYVDQKYKQCIKNLRNTNLS